MSGYRSRNSITPAGYKRISDTFGIPVSVLMGEGNATPGEVFIKTSGEIAALRGLFAMQRNINAEIEQKLGRLEMAMTTLRDHFYTPSEPQPQQQNFQNQ